MSEDADDASKTEEPTQKKLEKAHEQGQWPLSPEISNGLMIAATLILLISVFPNSIPNLGKRLLYYLEHAFDFPMDRAAVGHLLVRVVGDAFSMVWLPVLLLGAVGVYATIMQKGWNVSWELIVPKLSKLNPINGFGRLFSIVPQSVELLKSLAKLLVVGAVTYIVISPIMRAVEHFVGIELMILLKEIESVARRLLLMVLLIVGAIAAGDWYFQRYQYNKKMKMTKQEVKDEAKEADGDPQVKARIRSIRYERARKRMMANVPKSDVVVTNPTHFSVALKYDAEKMDAPMVVAKGVDAVALKIREVARENDVPIVENPPLARALYASVDIDEEIPSEHYRAVAELITYVMKLKQRSGRA